jgi:hypothetical protein
MTRHHENTRGIKDARHLVEHVTGFDHEVSAVVRADLVEGAGRSSNVSPTMASTSIPRIACWPTTSSSALTGLTVVVEVAAQPLLGALSRKFEAPKARPSTLRSAPV